MGSVDLIGIGTGLAKIDMSGLAIAQLRAEVEELGRKLETEASLRERDKFLVHVGEVINRTLLDLLLVFQVRVVTALLASLGWRLAQAQEHQGWHQGGAEKVCVANPDKRRQFFRVQTTIGQHGAG